MTVWANAGEPSTLPEWASLRAAKVGDWVEYEITTTLKCDSTTTAECCTTVKSRLRMNVAEIKAQTVVLNTSARKLSDSQDSFVTQEVRREGPPPLSVVGVYISGAEQNITVAEQVLKCSTWKSEKPERTAELSLSPDVRMGGVVRATEKTPTYAVETRLVAFGTAETSGKTGAP